MWEGGSRAGSHLIACLGIDVDKAGHHRSGPRLDHRVRAAYPRATRARGTFASRRGDRSDPYGTGEDAPCRHRRRSVRSPPRWWFRCPRSRLQSCLSLAVHRQELLVHDTVVVEDRPTHLRFGPRDRRFLRIDVVATGEGFVAITRRVEEVDAMPARGPVSGWILLDRYAVVGEDVRGIPYGGPVIDPECEVVQAAVLARHQRDVVRMVRML